MAQPPYRTPRRAGLSTLATYAIIALLILPSLALLRLSSSINPWFLLGYAGLISILTFLCYRHDKIRAQNSGWRTPESTLHLLELLGGWPGAFLAQRIFWHKISKRSYQFTFWCIVAAYQFTAFDYLENWRCSRQVVLLLQSPVHR